MANINGIIQFLDDYLLKSGRAHVEAVEANAMLNKAGLLSDSTSRPGKPLRDLLRKGLIPHAYQIGSRWKIPRSGSQRIKAVKPQVNIRPVTNGSIRAASLGTPVDPTMLKKQLKDARHKYKPKRVRILLVAEAPPDSIDRFFYYENVTNHDSLFLGVIEALYPELKQEFLANGRDPKLKRQILLRLQADGIYLLDLSELPLSLAKESLAAQVPRLAGNIQEIISQNTKIILIKANVFDLVYRHLTDAGLAGVIQERIPFPGSGRQAQFQSGFKRALRLAGFPV